MRMNVIAGTSAALIALFSLSPATAVIIRDHRSPSKSGGAYTLSAAPVFEMTLALTTGQTISCETRNLTGQADPVLHLLAPSTASGAVHEVATDDDSAGALNSRFTYTATATGRYRLILRAAGDGRTGTADLFCDGKPVWVKLPVAGAFKRLESLRHGETLTTLPLPQGPNGHLVYIFDDNGHMLERYLTDSSQGARFPLGQRPLENAMVGTVWPDITGPIRMVRNDAGISGHDSDGDGLGNELEQNIGTCSNLRDIVGNWDCSRSTDPRDTDGDGLTDGVELLGKVDSDPYQFLPKWGADPLHKDLFIQIDSRSTGPNDPIHLMKPDKAMALASIYGDPETEPIYRLAHAQTLQNPDLQAGIHVHLDTGINPAAGSPPSDYTTYGDWGGHKVASAVCDSNNNCHGAEASDIWQSMLGPNRVGLFHYGLGYPGSGGQAPYHTIALNIPLDDGPTASHELGHTLGMDHSGPQHNGNDANCKPNYPSIMSYAYLGSSGFAPQEFSDGYGRPAITNVSLNELNVVAPNSVIGKRYLQQLRDVFGFNVDTTNGSVDWNRDGAFSTSPVRAYANDNGTCEFTRVNSVPSSGLTSLSPTITRLGNMTIILYVDERDNKLYFDYTKDDLSCPGIENRCGPPLTHQSINTPWNSNINAVDAHGISINGQKRTLVVYRSFNVLFETILAPDLSWTTPVHVPNRSLSAEEFSLAGNDDHTILAFKTAQGNPIIKVRHTSTGTWDLDEPALDSTGAPISAIPAGSSPGLLEAQTRNGLQLFAVFPNTDQGNLRLYYQDPANGHWIVSPWSNNEEPSMGRPALAFEPVDPNSPLPGRLRILSMRRSDTGINVVRMRSLQAIGLGAAAVPKLVDEDFDNSWYYAKGVDLLYEPGIDSNLRAVVANALIVKDVPQPHSIELRPKADGVVDFQQKNANDWLGLGVDLCRTLTASNSSNIKCPAWPF
jgi:hypothetical protein